jgi:2-keto-4-pentenoate hydratase
VSDPSLDPRVARGMERQLAWRRARLAAGERPLGWKVGFGSAAAMERLGTDRALVGFLTDAGRLDPGATVSLAGWAAPALEPEIAVRVDRDVPGGASAEEVRDAIGALAPAIELADVDPPPNDVEAILAGNVFHRHVLLGPWSEGRRDAAGVTAALLRDGEEVAATDDPQALTGALADVVQATAALLAACGERLLAGDVVITGSVLPPLTVAPGEAVEAVLAPLGRVAVRLT